MDRNYFTLDPESDLPEKVAAFIEERKAVQQQWAAFRDTHGGTECWHRGPYCAGLSFEDKEPPEGWFVAKESPAGCYRPRSNRKACREAYTQFKALPRQLGGPEFSGVIGFKATNKGLPTGGFVIQYASFEIVDGQVIVSLPEDGAPVTGLISLARSEYWALKESAEAA